MNGVVLARGQLEEIRAHARSAYPDEACGFLIGPLAHGGPPGSIDRVLPETNGAPKERTRRYAIPPRRLLELETELEGAGAEIVGVYHSHPDHPAVPSAFDEEHAWPGLLYLILNVTRDGVGELNGFELDAEVRRFRPVPLLPSPDGLVVGAVPAVGVPG